MIDIESKLLKVLEESSCFGIAYDPDVPECKMCDLAAQCKAKCEARENGTVVKLKAITKEVHTSDSTPDKPDKNPTEKNKAKEGTGKAARSKASSDKKADKAPKPEKPVNPNAPDFKTMSLKQLTKLAEDHKIEWKDYGHENITRMRLIMTLKKVYE